MLPRRRGENNQIKQTKYKLVNDDDDDRLHEEMENYYINILCL